MGRRADKATDKADSRETKIKKSQTTFFYPLRYGLEKDYVKKNIVFWIISAFLREFFFFRELFQSFPLMSDLQSKVQLRMIPYFEISGKVFLNSKCLLKFLRRKFVGFLDIFETFKLESRYVWLLLPFQYKYLDILRTFYLIFFLKKIKF